MITQEILKDRLSYDPETGIFLWKKIRKSNKIGTRAGSETKHGYRIIYVHDKQYYEHQLAWLWVNGEIPYEIDHENRNGLDNKIKNLRSISHSGNIRNSSLRIDNTTGKRCIHHNSGGYRVATYIEGVYHGGGWHKTLDEAVKARDELFLKLFPKGNHQRDLLSATPNSNGETNVGLQRTFETKY